MKDDRKNLKEKVKEKEEEHVDPVRDRNPDPITDEGGSHPVGVAGGGAGGAAAGTIIGSAVAGPAGAIVGGVIGAVTGSVAGRGIAEAVSPTMESHYWKSEYRKRPYYQSGTPYEIYEPYYRYGWEAAARPEFQGRSYEDIEQQLEQEWPGYRGTANSDYGDYRQATRDAYERAHRQTNDKSEEREFSETSVKK